MTDVSTVVAIPRPLTPLIGRERELAMLESMLIDGARLVTITGIGGIGKTRLAHQFALELEPRFQAGAITVPLADIREARLIPLEIARRFDVAQESIDVSALVRLMGEQSRLLLLDNLEQIPGARDVVAELLSLHPKLTVLATSQLQLHIAGEHLFPLEPMPVADEQQPAEALRRSPAVALFLQRAKEVHPHQEISSADIRTIRDICADLEGIPLAIELAAARSALLNPDELKARLSSPLEVLGGGGTHLPARQRTMRNAIGWTYDLLDRDEQRIFRFLSVYDGGFGFEAVEHTLCILEQTATPLDVLELLVTRGFVRRLESAGQVQRFTMLPPLRQYALERITNEREEFSANLAHANYVLQLIDRVDHLQHGPDQERWHQQIEIERENIQTAAEWSSAHRPEVTLSIIDAFWPALDNSGISQRYIDWGLKAATAQVTEELLARGLTGIGIMEMSLEDRPDSARATRSRAVKLAQSSGNSSAEVRSLVGLGLIEYQTGKPNSSIQFFEDAARIAERTMDSRGVAMARANLAAVANDVGNLELGLEQYLLVLQEYRRTNNVGMIGNTLANIDITHDTLGNHALAKDYLSEALGIANRLNHVKLAVYSLLALGHAHASLGEFEQAHSLYEQGILESRKANRIVQELQLRIADCQIQFDQGKIEEAIRYIPSAITLTSSAAASDAILTGATITAVGCATGPDRIEAAGLVGAVLANEPFVTACPWNLKIAIQAFHAGIPEATSSPERTAFVAGGAWDLETIAFRTVEAANAYLRRLGMPKPEVQPAAVVLGSGLTPREREVLAMLVKGHTNAEIADEMFISLRTITTHVSNILAKLDVKNRATAVALAINHKLV